MPDLKVEDGNAIGAPSGRAFVRKRLPELFAPNLLSDGLGYCRLALVGGYRLGGSDTRHPGYVAWHVFNVEGAHREQQIYAPQTTIWEGRTNLSECVFDAPLNVLSPKYGTRAAVGN